MKHKVSELEGALLDAAVAKAEGKLFELMPDEWGETAAYLVLMVNLPEFRLPVVGDKVKFCPSSDWRIGGAILEIMAPCDVFSIVRDYGHRIDWYCGFIRRDEREVYEGPTPLIAAMRAYVASKLGDTVEMP